MVIKDDTMKKDLGLPFWRLKISVSHIRQTKAWRNKKLSYIHIEVENFKYGFIDGENWDKIFIMSKYYNYSHMVSIMTKGTYEHLMSYYDELVQVFYDNIFEIEKKLTEENKKANSTYKSEMDQIEDMKSSDIFKKIIREKQIDKII